MEAAWSSETKSKILPGYMALHPRKQLSSYPSNLEVITILMLNRVHDYKMRFSRRGAYKSIELKMSNNENKKVLSKAKILFCYKQSPTTKNVLKTFVFQGLE
jgi:hypothetical protein